MMKTTCHRRLQQIVYTEHRLVASGSSCRIQVAANARAECDLSVIRATLRSEPGMERVLSLEPLVKSLLSE